MKIFVIGYPSNYGGADTELWHTTKLWRSRNIDVSFIPTWRANEYESLLASIGCRTIKASPATLRSVDGLAGSTVVSFCNGEFLKYAHLLREIGCRVVWVNCMTFVFDNELKHYEEHGEIFDRYVFQSQYQREQIERKLRPLGFEDHHAVQIRGAFDVDEWYYEPRPHHPHDAFWVGRLARADQDKWSSNLWGIYGKICYPNVQAWCMGLDARTHGKLGPAPHWATCMPPGAMPAREYFSKLHCLLTVNGGAAENWPRVGLEAMAVGVPVVAQRSWGWQEMIVHGETGFLGNGDHELAHYAAILAHDEKLRMRIVEAARLRLVEQLANPERIADKWEKLFGDLANA